MVNAALDVGSVLSRKVVEAAVINARFVKPLDGKVLEEIALKGKPVFILEEGVASGGFGSAVMEFFERENIKDIKVRCLGLPDEFIEHGAREELLRKYHMTPDELAAIITSEL